MTEVWQLPLELELLFWILGMLPITVGFLCYWNLIYLMRNDESQGMAEIQVSVEIDAQIDNVWNIVSDIDNEPKFWKGTKEIRNISKNDNVVNREITIAFRDQKCMQEVKLYPKEKIEALFTKGVIVGSKIITLTAKDKKTVLDVKWDIKLSGMMGMFTGMIKKHIQSGTEQALQKIKEEIER